MSYKYKLYGAILGDLAGQPYEFKYKGDYSEFNIHDPKAHITDDTVMTLASAAYLLGMFGTPGEAYKEIGRKYPEAGYGAGFKAWLQTPHNTINDSWANGCLMRISPFMYLDLRNSKTKELIVESCMNSHNHAKSFIAVLDLHILYKMSEYYSDSDFVKNKTNRIERFKKFNKFDVSAEGTFNFIKEAAFQSYSTTLAIENTIKCGGDTDTNASIIAELSNYAYKDITEQDAQYVESKLDPYLLGILHEFNNKEQL